MFDCVLNTPRVSAKIIKIATFITKLEKLLNIYRSVAFILSFADFRDFEAITIYVVFTSVHNEYLLTKKKIAFDFPGSCLLYFDTSTYLTIKKV